MTERIRCPFQPCHSTVELKPARSSPYGDVPDISLIAPHDVEPDSWYGRCPASFLAYPLAPAASELLAQQTGTFRQMANTYKGPDKGIAAPQGNAAGEHPLQPHPSGTDGWLEPSEINKRNRALGQAKARGDHQQVEAIAKSMVPTTGGNLSSVGNVVAAIGAAGEALEEGLPQVTEGHESLEQAVVLLRNASQQFVKASGIINQELMSQGQGSDLVSTASSQVIQAIDAVDQAVNSAAEAIEQCDTAIALAHSCQQALDDFHAAVAR